MYPPCDGNICGKLRHNADVLINRTNNPLERFNRKLNEKFKKGSHPSVITFVIGIREISCDDVKLYDRVRHGHSNANVHLPVSVFPIPEDYYSFI